MKRISLKSRHGKPASRENILPTALCSYIVHALFCSVLLLPQSSTVTAQIKAPPRAGQNADVIVSRDGVHNGQLAGCVGDSCRIDNVSIARPLIVWIGLKSNIQSIPTPQDRLRDEVHYRDGSIHPGRLVGISASEVVTESGRHPRATVAWIYLTPRRQTAAPGQIGGPMPSPTPTPPLPTPTPTPRPPPVAPPSGPPPAGVRGGLWTGKIKQLYVRREDGVTRITTTIDDARLREYVQPLSILEGGKLRQVGTITNLFAEGGRISEQFRDLHIEDYGGPGGRRCNHSGEGTTTLIRAKSSSGTVWKKNVNVDTTTGVGWNVPSGPGLYHVGLQLHTLGRYTESGTCVDKDGTHVMVPSGQLFQNVVFGQFPPQTDPVDPELRFLDSTGSRMIGTYTNTRLYRGQKLTVSWSLCREGVRCEPPPIPAGRSVSLGNLFDADFCVLLADAKAKLDEVLSKLRADPGLMPEIRVMVVKGGATPLYLEILAKAEIDVLKAWFAERGIGASRISWTWETGASDQVLIAYE